MDEFGRGHVVAGEADLPGRTVDADDRVAGRRKCVRDRDASAAAEIEYPGATLRGNRFSNSESQWSRTVDAPKRAR
jgi:hypothetical protein